jgi:hypothetical protein
MAAKLVLDSPEVRRLILLQESRTSDSPEHVRFIAAMAEQPGIEIPARSYARLVESSRARCGDDPTNHENYLRVRVTTGALKGEEGWTCVPRDFMFAMQLP